MTAKYNLLLKGGRIIDPSQVLNDSMDIAFAGGKGGGAVQRYPKGRVR